MVLNDAPWRHNRSPITGKGKTWLKNQQPPMVILRSHRRRMEVVRVKKQNTRLYYRLAGLILAVAPKP